MNAVTASSVPAVAQAASQDSLQSIVAHVYKIQANMITAQYSPMMTNFSVGLTETNCRLPSLLDISFWN